MPRYNYQGNILIRRQKRLESRRQEVPWHWFIAPSPLGKHSPPLSVILVVSLSNFYGWQRLKREIDSHSPDDFRQNNIARISNRELRVPGGHKVGDVTGNVPSCR